MARKVVNRKELRSQNDAAEAREKSKKPAKEKAAKEKVAKEKPAKAKKEKPAKEPGKAAKKPSRKKAAKETRMKAYWGVFNQAMKRLALFEYSDRKAADKKASELMQSSRASHFVQLVKEAITE